MIRYLAYALSGAVALGAATAKAEVSGDAAAVAAGALTGPPSPGALPNTGAGQGAGGALSLSAGASAWSGDFGAPWKTDIRAALLSGRYRSGNLRLTASLPWMQIRSQGAVFTGIDGAPLLVAPGVAMTKSRRDGLGDLTLGVAHLTPSLGGTGLDLDVFGKVKLPTGSASRGVSTGKTDASFGAELSKPMGRFIPSASVSYRHFGDAGQWQLKDGFAGSVGGTYLVSDKLAAIVSYDYAEGASAFIHNSQEVVLGLSRKLGHEGLRLTGFVGAGLSDGAADASGGISITLAQ
jgi:hypothetical protein